MIGNLNLKAIKKKAFTSLNQDGLFDIFLGFVFLCIATYLYLDKVLNETIIIFVIMPAILLGPILQKMRKRYTYPRIGYVAIGLKKEKRMTIVLVISLTLIGLLVFTKFKNFYFPGWFLAGVPALFGMIILSMIVYQIYQYTVKRFKIYMIVCLLTIIIVYLIPMQGIFRFIIILTSFAAASIPIGLYTFVNFIKNNPILEDSSESNVSDNSIEIIAKANKKIHQDGLYDIAFGISLLIWIIYYVIGKFNDIHLYFLLIVPPMILSIISHIYRLSKVFPALGNELEIITAKQLSFLNSIILLFVFNVAAFIVFSAHNLRIGIIEFWFIPLITGIILSGYYLINASLYNIKRYRFYAMLIIVSLFIGYILHFSLLKQFIIMISGLSVLTVVLGFNALSKFLRSNNI